MDWTQLGKQIADKGAQILGSVLPYPGTDLAADAVSEALGVEKEPNAISEAIKQNPQAAAKLKKVEAEHEEELKRIAAERENAKMEEVTERQSNVNETIQTGYKEGVLWRRAVGWSFAVGAPLFGACALALLGIALYHGKISAMGTALKELITALHPLLYCYIVILGIAGYQDGKMGRFMAGDSGGGFIEAIKAFKGKKDE